MRNLRSPQYNACLQLVYRHFQIEYESLEAVVKSRGSVLQSQIVEMLIFSQPQGITGLCIEPAGSNSESGRNPEKAG